MSIAVKTWFERLDDEDVAFIKRFVLASGSLKKLAEEYSVSYPTIRLRLDRVIEKVKIFDSQALESEFERSLRALCAEGKIDMSTFKILLSLYKGEQED